MTAIFAAAAIPIMVIIGTLEVAKLVTCAWLARHWRLTPLLVRGPLTVMVLAPMTLTAIGSYGFLTKPHLQHQVEAMAVARDPAPLAQRIALAQATAADLDRRIGQLDAMVSAATSLGWTKTAMAFVARQSASRGNNGRTPASAERLADFKVREANVEAQRARVTPEAGLTLYLAKLFGSDEILKEWCGSLRRPGTRAGSRSPAADAGCDVRFSVQIVRRVHATGRQRWVKKLS